MIFYCLGYLGIVMTYNVLTNSHQIVIKPHIVYLCKNANQPEHSEVIITSTI